MRMAVAKAMIGFFIVKSPARDYIPHSPQKNAQVRAKDDVKSEEPVEEQVAVIAKRGQQGDMDGQEENGQQDEPAMVEPILVPKLLEGQVGDQQAKRSPHRPDDQDLRLVDEVGGLVVLVVLVLEVDRVFGAEGDRGKRGQDD